MTKGALNRVCENTAEGNSAATANPPCASFSEMRLGCAGGWRKYRRVWDVEEGSRSLAQNTRAEGTQTRG